MEVTIKEDSKMLLLKAMDQCECKLIREFKE